MSGAAAVSPAPTRFDPRRRRFAELVGTIDTPPPDADLGRRVAAALDGPRDVAGLAAVSACLPPRGAMAYGADDLAVRARRRMTAALGAAQRHGIGPARTVLDIGCGRGENRVGLEGLAGVEYIGLDIDPRHFPPAPLAAGVRFCAASADAMPLDDASIDLVVTFNVLEHLPNLEGVLREVRRVLRPGGVFFSQFGPPWNAPFGPHLIRQCPLPYLHHLYPEDVVAAHLKRERVYVGLNRRPLVDYRELLWHTDGLRCVHYMEHFTVAHAWLWRHALPAFAGLAAEERSVNRIDVALVCDGLAAH